MFAGLLQGVLPTNKAAVAEENDAQISEMLKGEKHSIGGSVTDSDVSGDDDDESSPAAAAGAAAAAAESSDETTTTTRDDTTGAASNAAGWFGGGQKHDRSKVISKEKKEDSLTNMFTSTSSPGDDTRPIIYEEIEELHADPTELLKTCMKEKELYKVELASERREKESLEERLMTLLSEGSDGCLLEFEKLVKEAAPRVKNDPKYVQKLQNQLAKSLHRMETMRNQLDLAKTAYEKCVSSLKKDIYDALDDKVRVEIDLINQLAAINNEKYVIQEQCERSLGRQRSQYQIREDSIRSLNEEKASIQEELSQIKKEKSLLETQYRRKLALIDEKEQLCTSQQTELDQLRKENADSAALKEELDTVKEEKQQNERKSRRTEMEYKSTINRLAADVDRGKGVEQYLQTVEIQKALVETRLESVTREKEMLEEQLKAQRQLQSSADGMDAEPTELELQDHISKYRLGFQRQRHGSQESMGNMTSASSLHFLNAQVAFDDDDDDDKDNDNGIDDSNDQHGEGGSGGEQGIYDPFSEQQQQQQQPPSSQQQQRRFRPLQQLNRLRTSAIGQAGRADHGDSSSSGNQPNPAVHQFLLRKRNKSCDGLDALQHTAEGEERIAVPFIRRRNKSGDALDELNENFERFAQRAAAAANDEDQKGASSGPARDIRRMRPLHRLKKGMQGLATERVVDKPPKAQGAAENPTETNGGKYVPADSNSTKGASGPATGSKDDEGNNAGDDGASDDGSSSTSSAEDRCNHQSQASLVIDSLELDLAKME